jgi:hypothetical protein
MENEFQEPTPWQAELMARMASVDIPSIEAIRSQLQSAKTRVVDNDGSFQTDCHGPPWVSAPRVPIEARYEDLDGIPIDILMHVIDGAVHEFEIYKVDGGTVPKDFPLSSLKPRAAGAGD